VISHYQIGRTIGKGTFGKVKLGVHTLTGEKVAVKILEKEKIKDSSDVERVSREIKILKQVNNPNIVKLYEIIETQKQLYLIMEYASGGELFDYIVARTRLKEQQACLFLQQILAGVEYLQLIRVVHRDLKPENLLLDNKNNIKIVDFGLSNLYKHEETLKTACGSPCYAAPEMIAGKRYHGAQVDIWSCGVILFAMVNGYLPFEDPNTSSLYKKIIAGDFKCGSWVSPEVHDLLKGILNTNPESRLTIDKIRAHKWFQKFCSKSKEPLSFDSSVLNENVLKQVEALGLSLEMTRESVLKNKHNKFSSTYFLLLKKHETQMLNFSLASRITSNNIPPANGRGESHSINPRIKKIYEIKVEKFNNSMVKDPENAMRVGNKTIVREIHYVRPAPRRKIVVPSVNSNRDPRAVSTGFNYIKNNQISTRDPPAQLPVSRRNPRSTNYRTPFAFQNDLAASLNITIRNQSTRAGTALDISQTTNYRRY
jgi:serine/threonine protein kinase